MTDAEVSWLWTINLLITLALNLVTVWRSRWRASS
jgi:hypothetical protein